VVDPGASLPTGKVSVDGAVAADSAPLFFLDGRTLEPLKTEGSTAVPKAPRSSSRTRPRSCSTTRSAPTPSAAAS